MLGFLHGANKIVPSKYINVDQQLPSAAQRVDYDVVMLTAISYTAPNGFDRFQILSLSMCATIRKNHHLIFIFTHQTHTRLVTHSKNGHKPS